LGWGTSTGLKKRENTPGAPLGRGEKLGGRKEEQKGKEGSFSLDRMGGEGPGGGREAKGNSGNGDRTQ